MSIKNILPDRIVRKAERRHLTGLPQSSWDTLEHAGQAPKRFKLTICTVAWSYNALLEWIECRKAGREWRSVGDAAKQVIQKLETQVSA
jgi:predicted DNA-binding transcriptional regulator AlpA